MPLSLIALLLAGEFVTTAPPPPPANTGGLPDAPPPAAQNRAPEGVVGVDLPAFPPVTRKVQPLPPPTGDRPSPALGFSRPFGDPPAAAPAASANEDRPRCRKTETPNGFTYSCGDPQTARRLEEETQQMLRDLLDPD